MCNLFSVYIILYVPENCLMSTEVMCTYFMQELIFGSKKVASFSNKATNLFCDNFKIDQKSV